MLNVYVKREDIGNGVEIIDSNDILFNYDLYNNMNVSPLIRNIMKSIDGAKYLQGMDMRSKFGNITSMENLSTGCKTVINIVNHPEAIINCIECGDNVLHKILRHLKMGNVLFEIIPSNADMLIDVNIITKQGNQVVNSLSEFIQYVDLYRI